jgi:hypothetical protein
VFEGIIIISVIIMARCTITKLLFKSARPTCFHVYEGIIIIVIIVTNFGIYNVCFMPAHPTCMHVVPMVGLQLSHMSLSAAADAGAAMGLCKASKQCWTMLQPK